ncbi:MAG TPA: serine hydrolase domain-containing protein [Gemmatimonadales bacterium]|nr:serine hydrolase domain-containing protein [Gemmatimonadales bacterium]
MSRFRSRAFLVLAAPAIVSCVAGRRAATPPPAATAPVAAEPARLVERFIEDTMRVLGAPGASICVMRRGEVLWSRAFGMADLEQRVPVTTATKFRIGSVSKALTSVALGRLVEEGLLDLDAPVQRYVPRFPVKRYPVTVRQVAGHLAGIRHYLTGEFENQRHYASPTEALAMFAADSLLFEPGTRFEYSSHGYVLLAAVIEGASGRPYLEYMRTAVLGPAHMTHTVAEHPDSVIPGRGRYYTRADSTGPVINAPFVDNTYKWASGGFLSTAEDLAHFGDRLLRGELLRPETVALLWTSMRTADGTATEYGIGWSVEEDSLGHRRVRHSGGSVGGTAHLIIYPDQEVVVAVLVNSDRTFIRAIPRFAEPFLPDM